MFRWTEDRIEMLKQVYKTHEFSIDQLAEIFGIGRNKITFKAKQLGLVWVDLDSIPDTHKYCKKCDRILHKDLFYKNKTKIDGYASNCIECQKSHKKKKQVIIELKTCPKCKHEKEIDQFSKNQSWCKNCNSRYYKQKGDK